MPLKKSATPAAFKANIKAEVKAGKTNEFHFELRSDARSTSPATGG